MVISQILQAAELADTFQQLVQDCNADHYEILLFVDKEESIKRLIARGKNQGHTTGFRTGGIMDANGGEKKLIAMYEAVMEGADARSNVIKIEPVLNDIEVTYSELLKNVG